ncbi:MAG: phosphoglycerate kinase, partial [Proteobacteria bacterium]|nr:phosphoglycerate kinase [Pseudomonadota bacterium]
ETVQSLESGQIALAENLRFYLGEESNDEKFAIDICHHFGVFVNDAFSDSHRAHASISQIPHFKPSCAGLLMEKEIEELSKALKPSKRPAIASMKSVPGEDLVMYVLEKVGLEHTKGIKSSF